MPARRRTSPPSSRSTARAAEAARQGAAKAAFVRSIQDRRGHPPAVFRCGRCAQRLSRRAAMRPTIRAMTGSGISWPVPRSKFSSAPGMPSARDGRAPPSARCSRQATCPPHAPMRSRRPRESADPRGARRLHREPHAAGVDQPDVAVFHRPAPCRGTLAIPRPAFQSRRPKPCCDTPLTAPVHRCPSARGGGQRWQTHAR